MWCCVVQRRMQLRTVVLRRMVSRAIHDLASIRETEPTFPIPGHSVNGVSALDGFDTGSPVLSRGRRDATQVLDASKRERRSSPRLSTSCCSFFFLLLAMPPKKLVLGTSLLFYCHAHPLISTALDQPSPKPSPPTNAPCTPSSNLHRLHQLRLLHPVLATTATTAPWLAARLVQVATAATRP